MCVSDIEHLSVTDICQQYIEYPTLHTTNQFSHVGRFNTEL